MDSYNDDILKENKELKAQISALKDEIELLRTSFPANENFYKERFHRISGNINYVIYRFRIEERKYDYISPQVEDLLGYKPEEFYASTHLIRHIIHPKFFAEYISNWKNILQGNVPEYFELKIITRDGEVRWVQQKNLAVYNQKNQVVSIEGVLTDITERKNTETTLVENESQKRAILNNIPHLVWMKNCDGDFLFVNNAFAEKYNKNAENIIGGNDFDIYGEGISMRYRNQDLQVIKSCEKMFIEEQTNDTYWETIKAPIFNSNDEVIGVSGVALEITEHKKKEEEIKEYSEKLAMQNVKQKLINEELKQAKDNAEKADRLKTAFLANMSHEIRTPMNAILGFATLLRDRKLTDEKQAQFINLINTNSRQLLHIISDIIDISKIESDQITIFNKDFNINKIITGLKLNFENTIRDAKKDLVIKTQFDLADENAQICTDKVRLEQILSNLLSNAIKFTEKGKIECGYKVDSKNNEIDIFVRDTGIGMTKKEQSIIFDRFRQASSSYSKLYGGTGLGLSISKGLAIRLGGKISVESKIGKGATFFLRLPYKQGVPEKPEKIAYTTKYNWIGRTILIAEDEVANYTLLDSIIKPTKANIIWVKNGIEAVDACKCNKEIDLVLMDVKMPEMNGLEATKIIKKENSLIPIIAQTAFAMPQDEENCINAGCDDYLSKPLKIDDILSKIQQYIHEYNSKNQIKTARKEE